MDHSDGSNPLQNQRGVVQVLRIASVLHSFPAVLGKWPAPCCRLQFWPSKVGGKWANGHGTEWREAGGSVWGGGSPGPGPRGLNKRVAA